MDVKGITWFGNVYQKFETMCLEVEEAVCQDTVKFVENQVQTIGASVKKFYSEVVDDLLSPSLMDPVKVNSHSCTAANKKPKMGIKEEPKRQLFEDRNATTKMDKSPTCASPFDRFSNADPAVPCNPVSSTEVLSSNFSVGSKGMGVSSKKVNLVIKRKPKTVTTYASEVPKVTNAAATNPDRNVITSGALKIESVEAPSSQIFEQQLDPIAVSRDSKEADWKRTGDENQENFKLKQIADASVEPSKIIRSDGTGFCHLKESVDGRSSENEYKLKTVHSFDALNGLTSILPSDTSSHPNGIVDYEVPCNASGFNNLYSEEWTTPTEETDGWNIETITSDDDHDDDDVEEGTEIMDINSKNHSVLEESCIIVDRDNLPFCSHKEPKHKSSYKKKLREAFSSRGKSMIKKEYRQLAAQYESATSIELEQHSAISSLHTSTPTSEEKKLKTSAQLCESEWEIL